MTEHCNPGMRRQSERGGRRWNALVLLALAMLPAAAPLCRSATAPTQSPEKQGAAVIDEAPLLAIARKGMYQLLDGDPDGALTYFEDIRRRDPSSPLGYLFAADAYWWKIYLTTGNLVDPDVFDVVRTSTSPYDATFKSFINKAIQTADARVQAQQNLARSLLEEGMAYGLLARFYGLRDNDLPTARAGKRMRALLLRALKLNPELTDANLGVGIYNYFVDTLPTIIKLLRFLIALPGGSRELGLEQLRTAATKGDLTRGEAQFYLAKDFSRRDEQQYAKSLELFQELASEYPDNLVWKLVEGSLEIRLGHRDAGDALYKQVAAKSAGLTTDVGRAIHSQVEQALARMHGETH